MKIIIRTIIIILYSSLSCLIHSQSVLSINNIDEELLKNANAVVRYYDIKVTVKPNLEVVHSIQYAITVLNKKLKPHLDFAAGYKEGSEKIKEINLSYLDASGQTIRSIKSKEIEDNIGNNEYSFISDYRYKYFDFETSDYPVTIVCSYELHSKNSFIHQWKPIFGFRTSLERSVFSIDNQSTSTLNMYSTNFEEFNVEDLGDRMFRIENVKAVNREKYMPHEHDVFPLLKCQLEFFIYENIKGSCSNWEELGNWTYNKMLKTSNSIDKEKLLLELSEEIDPGLDKKEIVEKAYNYLQENTRYVYIGFDEGGFKPLDVEKVHEYKYGDCKALSYYLSSILDLYDIESDYVIVYAGSNSRLSLKKDFASLNQANHIILRVPLDQDTIWLECTSHNSPFNFLGSFTDNRDVLLVNEKGGQITRTPDYGHALNTTSHIASIVLDEELNIDAEVLINTKGMGYSYIKTRADLDEKESHEYIYDQLFASFDNLDLKNKSYVYDEKEILASEKYAFSAANHGELAGDYILIPVQFNAFSVPKLKKTKKRKFPIYFIRDQQEESQVTYTIPEGYTLDYSKDNISLQSEYGEYLLSVENKDESSFTITRIFKINQGTHIVEDYAKIKLFFDSIRKQELEYIAIKKKKT